MATEMNIFGFLCLLLFISSNFIFVIMSSASAFIEKLVDDIIEREHLEWQHEDEGEDYPSFASMSVDELECHLRNEVIEVVLTPQESVHCSAELIGLAKASIADYDFTLKAEKILYKWGFFVRDEEWKYDEAEKSDTWRPKK